jgi:hypothetical protein
MKLVETAEWSTVKVVLVPGLRKSNGVERARGATPPNGTTLSERTMVK